MVLKRIEIFGFKSFPERTVVDFPDGITAIVGPNGCGKSNVSDAIRWVLGEQSAKSLRGDKMEDVIFNGTTKRPPLGFAEVILTFDNTHKIFPVEFTEVAIGRRLFRDGGSLYTINKQECRLRDIYDLMMDSGIGRRQHAIIEQGKIEEIVMAKPEERRQIIEEAAGIAKYRSRRTEALRRLDSTREGLRRVDDLIAELERQEGSLKRQSKKAERYREVEAELKALEIAAAARRVQEIVEQVAGLAAQEESAQQEAVRLEAELATVMAETAQGEETLAGLREELRLSGQELSAAERDFTGRESRLQELKARQEDDGRTLETVSREIVELERQLSEEQARQAEAVAAAAELEGELAASRERQKAAAERSGEESRCLARLLEEQRHLSGRFNEVAQGVVRRQAEIASLRGRIEEIAARRASEQSGLEELQNEGRELEEARTRLAAASDELSRSIAERRAARDERERAALDIVRRLDELTSAVHEDENKLAVLKERLTSASNRVRQSVEELEALIGERPGVKARPVTELLSCPPEHVAAVAAALGEALYGVYIETAGADGRAALEMLASSIRGKIVIDGGYVTPPAGYWECRPCLTPLASVLPPAVPSAIRSLLAGWYLVETREEAERLRPSLDDRERLVTANGEIYWPFGARRLPLPAETDGSLAGREKLQAEIASLESANAERGRMREELQARRLSEVAAAGELTATIEGDEARAGQLQNELAALTERLAAVTARRAEALGELNRLAQGASADEAKLAALVEREQAESRERDSLQQVLAALNERLQEAEEALAAARQEQAEADNAVNLVEERRRSRLSEAERLAASVAALAATRARQAAMSAEIAARREQTAATCEELRQGLAQLAAVLDEKREAFHRKETAVADLAATLAQRQARQRELAAARERALGSRHEAEMKRVALAGESRIESERIRDRYQVDIATVNLAEQPAVDPLRIEELREMIGRMGAVNFAAAEELSGVSERLAFYRAQRTDLARADEDLAQVVKDIDDKTVTLFNETFTAVNANFGLLFNRLFIAHGDQKGSAELVLLDPEHPLESGIDIIAMPPGKKPQSITLLSGGEKAMTAISLLFAVFLVRPSPFAILDELDAPLDEANVERYARVLKEFSQRTQFLVVTHNKRTMEIASTLYGVAMPERGVSSIFGVKLAEAAGLASAGSANEWDEETEREQAAG